MAGSLNHIVRNDGTFTMTTIDHLGDACEALHECFHIILALADGDMKKINRVCNSLNFPTVKKQMVKSRIDAAFEVRKEDK